MNRPRLTNWQQVLGVAVVAVVVGVLLWPTVTGATGETTQTVAVVEIEGPILGSLADSVEQELRDIRQNDSVKAVVLKMNTPGGAPAASERMYMAVQRTSKEGMPVIASVQGVSASGGYYTMLPADTIYTLPTSLTGSVGLAASAPRPSEPVRGPSGPNKRGGTVIGQWAFQQTIADTFIDTVMAQRGENITVPRSEVAKAKVYLGTRAVQNGFADKIGSVDEAVREAAARAGLSDYQVDTRTPGAGSRFPFLVRTDTQVVAVHAPNPGYGEIQPMNVAFVYKHAIPHVDTVEQLSRTDVRAASNNGQAGSPGPSRPRQTTTEAVTNATQPSDTRGDGP